jgi:hypothetical protein
MATVTKRLREEASSCWSGEPRPDLTAERLLVRYTVAVGGGRVAIEDVEVADSTLGDAPLERCVLDRIRRLTWDLPGAADARRRAQDSISIAALSE